MSVKLKYNPGTRTIELRMGCGERLSLYQTESLNERPLPRQQSGVARTGRPADVEYKR